MAITSIEFGKNLRPSTVDALNKINEVIAALNQLQPSEIDQLQSDVSTLKSQMSTANGNISTLKSGVTANTDDITNIKKTLYTPLKSDE